MYEKRQSANATGASPGICTRELFCLFRTPQENDEIATAERFEKHHHAFVFFLLDLSCQQNCVHTVQVGVFAPKCSHFSLPFRAKSDFPNITKRAYDMPQLYDTCFLAVFS